MIESPVRRVRIVEKDTIEREASPLYACTTLFLPEPAPISLNIYHIVLAKIASGTVKIREPFQYYGMPISQSYLEEDETTMVLYTVAKIFQKNNINFHSGYLDSISPHAINLGLYLDNEEELEALKKSFGENIKIAFIGDVQANGEYVMRDDCSRAVGHTTSELHLKGNMDVI